MTESPRTIADLLEARAVDDHLAITFEGRRWTWAQVVHQARRRAAMLTAARVDGPFHVGVLLDNVPEYLLLLAAAGLGGATLVGLNPTRRGEHLAHDVRHTDCQLIITDHEHRRLLDGLDLELDAHRILEYDVPRYEDALPPGSDRPATIPEPDDLLLLIFTSGSSGAPKAVRMTQGRATRASDSPLCTRDDVPYCAMPLFHGNAINSSVLPAIRTGAAMSLRRRFSASEFIDDVRADGCTYFSAIGRVLNYILATPERFDDDCNDLKLVLAPESSPLDIAAFQERFGCPVITGYGSSENAIVLWPAPPTHAGALGVAPPGDDIVVVDAETGKLCAPARHGEHGELLNADEAIGELVGRNSADRFEGYYKNPEAEQGRRRNGWYWSGDLAYRDDDGVFWFAGRTADWIRVDGENFATAPIERILERLPGVRGVVAYGVPDERNAEDQVMVTLQVDNVSVFDAAEFAAFLEAQPDLGTKWAPRFVRLVEQIPTTATNKIDKGPYRADRWHTTDPIWWRPNRRENDYHQLEAIDVTALDAALASNRAALADSAT